MRRSRRRLRPEDGRGERREPDLELVDRRRVAARADRLRASSASRAAEGEEALAVRGELERDLAADPVGDADEVRGVLLGEVLDAVGAGNGEVDRLAATRRRAGAGSAAASSTSVCEASRFA